MGQPASLTRRGTHLRGPLQAKDLPTLTRLPLPPYLPLERSHVLPAVGFGVIFFHFPKVLSVVAPSHCIDRPAHHADTEIGVLLLQGLDLKPLIVSWVIPCKETGQIALQEVQGWGLKQIHPPTHFPLQG